MRLAKSKIFAVFAGCVQLAVAAVIRFLSHFGSRMPASTATTTRTNEVMTKVSAGFAGPALATWALLGALVFPGASYAVVTYDGAAGMNALIINGGGAGGSCNSCHNAASPTTCNLSTVSQIGWLDSTNATQRYNSVVSCASSIHTMISTSFVSSRMPPGGPFFTNGEVALFNLWISDGRLRSASPTVATTAMTNAFKDNDSATLRGTVDQSGSSLTSTIFNYGITPSLASSVSASGAPGGSGGSGVDTSISGAISSLNCGTGYSFRARSSNSVGTTNGTTRTFSTDSCSNPGITVNGIGSTIGNRIVVPKNGSFTQASLSFTTSDNDTSIATWSFGTPTSGSITVNNASTGAFTYNASSSAGSAQFTVTVTDSDPASGGGPNMASDTVFVTITDSAPQFRSAAFPGGAVITVDSFTVLEGNGSTPSQSLNMFANDADAADTITWSIFSGPTRGSLSALNNATGSSNSITYTPNNNVDINDSFVIRITDGTTPVDLTVTANVTPVPDNPTAGNDGPFTFDVGVPVTVSVLGNDNDVDTLDTFAVAPASIATSPGATAVAVTANTQIQYTSAATQFTDDTFQYQIVDSPGGAFSNVATVTMRPRDSDGDGVIDYLDNCAATPNPGQLDTDNDQVINVNTAMDPGGNIGGNACDLDDDGDTIPDIYELANMMDPLDFSDAAGDNDGDGITNLQEFLDGTNPNFTNLVIDATGYLTPFNLPIPDPASVHPLATSVLASDYGPYRPGRQTITWTGFTGNITQGTSDQTLDIRPLVSFSASQLVSEGDTMVTVEVSLNGLPPGYSNNPIDTVTVNYSVSGTADNPLDHDATTGTVTFTSPSVAEMIQFDVFNDALAESNESVIFTIDSVTNAAIGSNASHQVTIIEGNKAPVVDLRFMQNATTVGTTYLSEGGITIDVMATDSAGQMLSYDWSATTASGAPVPGATSSWPVVAPAGNYLIDVIVTDDGTPAMSTRISRILNVVATAPTLPVNAMITNDTDGDGVDDVVEGYGDSDGDGIPDYLDANSNGSTDSNMIPDQTVDISSSFLIMTEPGLNISSGGTAQAANNFGVLITDQNLEDFGDPSGGMPVNFDDNFDHFGGIYDFEVRGLVPGSSVKVVIPLQSTIPRNAVYRKYNPASGWSGFVLDANNAVFSAPGALGACPEPGSSLYTGGLGYLHYCIQLMISDGGPNDTDNSVNGVATDPGTVAVSLTDPTLATVEEGGGRMSPLLLALLLLLGGFGLSYRLKGVRPS